MAQSKILSPHSHQRCQPGHLYPKTLAHKPFFHLHTTSQTLRHCGWQATGQGISPAETARASGSQRQIKGGKSARFRLAKPVQGRGERMLEAEQRQFRGEGNGCWRRSKAVQERKKAYQRRPRRPLPAQKGNSDARQGTKQPARKDSKRNKRGGKAPLFRLAKQFTGGARHNRAGARQIRGGKAAGLRPAKTQNSCWASAGWQFRQKGTEAGGKTKNQMAASKQVLGRRRQKEAAKAGKETAAFAVSNWVAGY